MNPHIPHTHARDDYPGFQRQDFWCKPDRAAFLSNVLDQIAMASATLLVLRELYDTKTDGLTKQTSIHALFCFTRVSALCNRFCQILILGGFRVPTMCFSVSRGFVPLEVSTQNPVNLWGSGTGTCFKWFRGFRPLIPNYLQMRILISGSRSRGFKPLE